MSANGSRALYRIAVWEAAVRDRVEVAIVGGGLAGTLLASALGRRGTSVALVDRHAAYPADFRAEKLTGPQFDRLRQLGLDEALRRVATPIDRLAIARFGRVVERRQNRELGIDYADLVAAARAEAPPGVLRIGRVARVELAEERRVVLADGRAIAADLVVLATGLERGLIEQLGIARVTLDPEHCLAIGFDLAPTGASRMALTYHGERTDDRSAYLTLFPVGDRLRANLFVYRHRGDDWADAFRAAPEATLRAMMPALEATLGELKLVGQPVLRPIGLTVTEAPARDGLVLVGDAFATTCPTGGTGLDKVLTDVERLAALAPGWLAAGDTSAAAIARFYDDPIKRACDARARRMIAYARGMAVDPGLVWTARRYRNFWALRARDGLRRLVRRRAA